jgi:hypothetical protein
VSWNTRDAEDINAIGSMAVQGRENIGWGWRPMHKALKGSLFKFPPLPALWDQGRRLAICASWLAAANRPCLRPSIWEGGGCCFFSAHPVADPARWGVKRGQLPGSGPRRAEVVAGLWVGWELVEQAGGVGSD